MKRVIQKLRAKAGESIGETLIALLISALALLMLAGAISSASNIITKSNKAMNDYYTHSGSVDSEWQSLIENSVN